MTLPYDVIHASRQLQEWLEELKERALLGSHNQSYSMLRGVLQEIRDRVPIDAALRFADALPPLVRGIMLERWHPAATAPPSRPFLDAVKARLEPHTPPFDSIVDDVLAVLAHRTDELLLPVLTENLPAELQAAWRALLEPRPRPSRSKVE
jgi:uncharacterized protein (DUF2267 family)